MNGTKLFDALANVDGAVIDRALAAPEKGGKKRNLVRHIPLTVSLLALVVVTFTACAVIAEQKEYTNALEFFNRNNIDYEGYTREEIKKIFNGNNFVEHVGTVPDWLKTVVDADLFKGVTAYSGRLLKEYKYVTDAENHKATNKITMMDVYGNILAECTLETDEAYTISYYNVTEDGGFIFTLGFFDSYFGAYDVSAKIFASRIIKCDSKGSVQFDISLYGFEGAALGYITEKNGCYYIFGTHRDAAKLQEYGETDVYVLVLDQNGEPIADRLIRGSGFDSLSFVEETEDGFLLYAHSASADGDFTPIDSDESVYNWIIRIDTSLNITERKKAKTPDFYSYLYNWRIGERNGEPVFQNDDIFKDFDAGIPFSFIEYDDFYIVVSSNITGIDKETISTRSSDTYYFETVYSGYDKNGKLLFRTAVDSSL